MWEVKILTGPQRGQIFRLSKGLHRIGRRRSCEITLTHPQISKEHACIEVYDDKIIISDMKSRNGTFVNGIQIKSQILQLQDQISIYDIRLHIQPASTYAQFPTHPRETVDTTTTPPLEEISPPGEISESKKIHPIEKFNKYLEDVALPAIYKLPEIIEVKWALGIFILAFATIVTLLSVIPATLLLKSSVEKEAQKRALTITSAMARENRNAIATQVQTALSVRSAVNEPGVNKALIISNPDGRILAPANLAGQYASETPFIYSAMKIKSDVVEQLDNNLIGVSIPIRFYNPSTGTSNITANAIVIYDMSSIAINSTQTTSLYIQVYTISIIFGCLLLFLIYKMTNHPIVEINKQLDKALKDEVSNIESPYQLVSLQLMVSNINSALNRMSQEIEETPMGVEYDRSQELTHLVQLIGFAAIGITSHDLSITAINQEFEERTGMHESSLLHTSVDNITDQALKLSIKDLIEKAQNQPDQMTTNELEIAGINCELIAQPVYGRDAISYYLIVILPSSDSDEEAA